MTVFHFFVPPGSGSISEVDLDPAKWYRSDRIRTRIQKLRISITNVLGFMLKLSCSVWKVLFLKVNWDWTQISVPFSSSILDLRDTGSLKQIQNKKTY